MDWWTGGLVVWWSGRLCHTDISNLNLCPIPTVHKALRSGPAFDSKIVASLLQQKAHPMNTIIYIVGLVVVIGFILSYFGFR